MAQINLLITVGGAASAEDAERLAMRLLLATKPVKTVLEAAGHRITAKAAMPCECCEGLVDVRAGGLCSTCAGDQVMDRQLQELLEHGGVLQLQPAEAML